MADAALLHPLLTLVGWTFVMWVWLYATRFPAIHKAKVDLKEMSRTGQPIRQVLPPEVSRVADNYSHLHEQPTLFYALVLCASQLGAVDSLQVGLAWTYVALRIVHSIIQSTQNVIPIRFVVFLSGSIVLFALFIRTVLML